ncbi:MAG: hypothetical protein JRJ51_03435 [Deltaproteobacteria bacterium]|nr:hypothetical protein [Deltaproteobacteria bacterium]
MKDLNVLISGVPAKEFFEKAVAFARNFADRFHHYKEEHVMFAQLAEKKAGFFDGPICIMLPSV